MSGGEGGMLLKVSNRGVILQKAINLLEYWGKGQIVPHPKNEKSMLRFYFKIYRYSNKAERRKWKWINDSEIIQKINLKVFCSLLDWPQLCGSYSRKITCHLFIAPPFSLNKWRYETKHVSPTFVYKDQNSCTRT